MTSDATRLVIEEATSAARDYHAAQLRVESLEAELAAAKQERQYAANDLERILGVGGVIEVPDLGLVFISKPGRRSVNKRAVDGVSEQLPRGVRPHLVETMKYPTAADLDFVADVLRSRGVDPETLVDRGEPTVTVKAAE